MCQIVRLTVPPLLLIFVWVFPVTQRPFRTNLPQSRLFPHLFLLTRCSSRCTPRRGDSSERGCMSHRETESNGVITQLISGQESWYNRGTEPLVIYNDIKAASVWCTTRERCKCRDYNSHRAQSVCVCVWVCVCSPSPKTSMGAPVSQFYRSAATSTRLHLYQAAPKCAYVCVCVICPCAATKSHWLCPAADHSGRWASGKWNILNSNNNFDFDLLKVFLDMSVSPLYNIFVKRKLYIHC